MIFSQQEAAIECFVYAVIFSEKSNMTKVEVERNTNIAILQI